MSVIYTGKVSNTILSCKRSDTILIIIHLFVSLTINEVLNLLENKFVDLDIGVDSKFSDFSDYYLF